MHVLLNPYEINRKLSLFVRYFNEGQIRVWSIPMILRQQSLDIYIVSVKFDSYPAGNVNWVFVVRIMVTVKFGNTNLVKMCEREEE